MFNPFTVITSKIFLATTIAAAAFGAAQTVRIEGVGCSTPKPGEKPACLLRGFKQDVQVIRIDLEAAEVRGFAERMAHQQTKLDYRAAQADAQRLEHDRLAAVSAHQKEISDAVAETYRARLADARARAEQLRNDAGQGGAPAGGASSGQPVPAAVPGTARAAEATGDRGLPVAAADWRLVATEQAIQLDELITLVERQSKVETNPSAEPKP